MATATVLTLLTYIVIGAILGFLLGPLLKSGGFGWFGNLCLGILGAFIGGLAATYGNYVIDNNLMMNAMAAAAGSVLFTLVVALLKRR
ncbi:hypothetical protein AB833_03830 [Chromatiales bacterium (ex Bugula neritina AB1)]|nr:hypothetical protein AB833_03830 [Chromatiales bacterium (ex Bugula neritina AB1)]